MKMDVNSLCDRAAGGDPGGFFKGDLIELRIYSNEIVHVDSSRTFDLPLICSVEYKSQIGW